MDDVLEAAGHEDSEDLVEEKLQDGLTADTDEVLEAAGHKSSEDLVDEAVKKLENGLIAAMLKKSWRTVQSPKAAKDDFCLLDGQLEVMREDSGLLVEMDGKEEKLA